MVQVQDDLPAGSPHRIDFAQQDQLLVAQRSDRSRLAARDRRCGYTRSLGVFQLSNQLWAK